MRLALLAAALLLGACAGVSPGVSQPLIGTACELKVVHAMTSPGKPVAGAFACFDSHNDQLAAGLADGGITDDASLAAFAAGDPVYTSARSCASQHDGFDYYELRGSSGTQVMRLRPTAPGGLVAEIGFRGMGSSCK